MDREELIVNYLDKETLSSYFCIRMGRLNRSVNHPSYKSKGRKITGTTVSIKGKTYKVSHILFRMSRRFRKIPVGYEIDHRNRNSRDNRVKNLRRATFSESQSNRVIKPGLSGFRGVSRNGNGWRARINVNKQKYNLGTFKTRVEAARRYNEVASKVFGKYAVLNDI